MYTVSQLRAALEQLEREGKGELPVLVADCGADGEPCGFGLGVWADAVVMDYTAEFGTIWRTDVGLMEP